MNKGILIFRNTDIDKCKFHYSQYKIHTNDVDIEKI